jgi:hypothetical protein
MVNHESHSASSAFRLPVGQLPNDPSGSRSSLTCRIGSRIPPTRARVVL